MVVAQYPFESHFHSIAGQRMHYLDEGNGAPIVMVHGNPTWSFYYRRLVEAFREQYRVIVPDHIGCGFSDKPNLHDYPYNLARRVDDLEALLDHLELPQKITLVVHDWGGMIGMGYAVRHPEKIARLVILNTSAFPLPPEKSLPWQIWLCRNTPLGSLLVRGFNAFCQGAVRTCTVQPMPVEVRAGYLAPYDSWSNRVAVLRFVQDIPLSPDHESFSVVQEVENGLAQFRETPMLICWGAQDFVFDDHFLNGWKQRFPQAEVHRFEQAGHYVLEDAWPSIIPLMRDFLVQTGGD